MILSGYISSSRLYRWILFGCFIRVLFSSHCETGYYPTDNSVCSPCPSNCTSCVSNNVCNNCKPGHFGTNCSHGCPFCMHGSCNKDTGFCIVSCVSGYYFGANLSCVMCPENCRDCASEIQCSGCMPGYTGQSCTEYCGYCKPGTDCDQLMGYCHSGCLDGFSGKTCNTPCLQKCASCERLDNSACITCSIGIFGDSCEQSCPQSCKGNVCDKINGTCTHGCIHDFYGQYCENKLENFSVVTGWVAGAAIGAATTLITLFVLKLVLKVCRIRKNRRFPSRKRSYTEKDSQRQSDSTPLRLLKDNNIKKSKDYPSSIGIKETSTRHELVAESVRVCSTTRTEPELKEESLRIVDEGKKSEKACEMNMSKEISSKDLKLYLEGKDDAEYRKEFQYLSSKTSRSTDGEKNNLCVQHISAYEGRQRVYIVCKDPLHEDLDTFWKLVWEENCQKIVWLTRNSESSTDITSRYLKTEVNKYGDISVNFGEGIPDHDHTYVSRVIELQTTIEEKTITHLHFNDFPTIGQSREATTLINFLSIVNPPSVKSSGPLLVHFSDGVTLCGMFVALDIIIDTLESQGCVNICKCVQHLKEQSDKMINTTEEYKFLHEALTCF